jgi:alpha/beta superfamily hydrolase
MRRAPAVIALLAMAACAGGVEVVGPRRSDEATAIFSGPEGDLGGSVFGDGEVGVVLAHMNGADRSSWFDFAEILADQGYTALAFDFVSEELDEEVLAAATWMRAQDHRALFLIGASKGALASLLAAARDQGFAGVAGLSAVVSFEGLEITQQTMQAIDAPKLLLVGEEDDYLTDSEQLSEWEPNAELVVLADVGDHGTDLFGGDAGDRTRAAILNFLERNS